MINFRFHLVSLVAVFLAIGVGVAMGASFVDRATVDSMRNSLDQLESNYRERGTEIDDLRAQLRAVDEQNAELFDEESALLTNRLADRNMVVIAPSTLSPEALDASWAALERAGATRSGTVRLEPTISLDDEDALAQARELLGLDSASPALVRGRLTSRLATALATLTASAPEQDVAPETPGAPDQPQPPGETTTTLPEFRPLGPVPTAAEVLDAQAFIAALVDAGLVTVDTGGAPDDAAFPAVDEVSYVMLVEDGTTEAATSSIHRLARDVADAAPATVTVGEASAPRAPGELSPIDADRVGGLLVDLRSNDDAVYRLSTVDHLDEVVGRVALALAVAEQFDGRVGHYGVGTGATAPLPSAANE